MPQTWIWLQNWCTHRHQTNMYRLRGDWAYFGGCLKQANHGFHVVHLICLFAFISSTHICLPVNLSTCLSIISIYHIYRSYPIIDHIYMYRSIYPTNYRSIDWSIYNIIIYIYLFIYLSICLSIYRSGPFTPVQPSAKSHTLHPSNNKR